MKTLPRFRYFIYILLGAMQVGAFGAFLVTAGLAPVPAIAAPAFPALELSQGAHASRNWAGYVAENGLYTSVSASWVVPSVPETARLEADATWVGIGGITSKDLIQAGTQAITDSKGHIAYEAWYELLPKNSETVVSLAVAPGDRIDASISEEGSGQWLIILSDATTGKSFSTTVAYDSSLSSAEWIEEMPTGAKGFIPLDQFGAVDFSSASAVKGGATLSAGALGASPLVLVSGRRTLATPSALAPDGASFSVTRTAAPARKARGG